MLLLGATVIDFRDGFIQANIHGHGMSDIHAIVGIPPYGCKF
jgi:hypothetical protein